MRQNSGSSWLVLGDINDQFYGSQSGPSSVLAARLSASTDGQVATRQLVARDFEVEDVHVLGEDGTITHLRFDHPLHVWDGLAQGSDVATILGRAGINFEGLALAPTMVVEESRISRALASYEVLVCTRVRRGGLVFTRAGEITVRRGAGLGEVLSAAAGRAQSWNSQVAGESHQTHNFEPETEVEAKVTVLGDAQPWALAATFGKLAVERGIPGFVPDLGNEMQRWQYRQETFEVVAPESEVGYVAFIHEPNQHYLVKQKVYATDTLRRREVFDFDVHLPDDAFEEHLSRAYPELITRRLPSLSRSRFDVNIESQRSGHFYGIEIDEVVAGLDGRTLRQVEIEYHHSRRHEGLCRDAIEDEVLWLRDFVSQRLTDLGVEHRVDFYSKLTFLRDCVQVPAATT